MMMCNVNKFRSLTYSLLLICRGTHVRDAILMRLGGDRFVLHQHA